MNSSPPRHRVVALLTGGRDKHYALGLASALLARNITFDFIGSDVVDGPELHNNPQVRFLNLRRQQAHASLGAKVVRILKYYLHLVKYAALAEPSIFHILWNNKVESFDRTLLMLYYRLLGKKLVLTVHNVNAGKRDQTDSAWNRLTLRIQYLLAHHLFVHTEKMRVELENDFHVVAPRITVIPLGINNTVPNTRLSALEAKRQLGVAPGEKAVLFFGQIAPYKGLVFLIHALAHLITTSARYRLIIAGNPKWNDRYWRQVDALIAEKELGDRVIRHIEFIPDERTEVYFKAADVLVLPYTHVFQSGVLFLAYSFGLPAIATDVGSLKEDIIEGETGFVCPPHDADGLAATIARYFESDLFRCLEKRRSFIKQYANERYSWDTVAALTLNVYARLISRCT